MIQGLPHIMSPTIPPWPGPTRSSTGGKQPGKLPKAPFSLDATSDESSDSGSDSGESSLDDAESEGALTDSHTRSRMHIGYVNDKTITIFFFLAFFSLLITKSSNILEFMTNGSIFSQF